ncbi:27404_t:CDS:2 [Gigaspora margarita]|uniref:27404_t:CDS:1 n=1 Tax=Gigaspora margarita TaxID=4874 RepID=A0ABN7VHN1_GIGMA|nr:27404_t:CDS:2 [Gigaspora margarita]
MDKNQVTQLVIGYLNHYLPEAEKALAEVEKITDLQKKSELVNSAHSKHSYYSTHANGLCSQYGLNINGVSDYSQVVDKLYNIKNETEKKLSASRCVRCKKAGIIPYKEINKNKVVKKGKISPIAKDCCGTYWNKKQCSGSNCSNLLTNEEICYCATCSAQQEQVRKNLDKAELEAKLKELEEKNNPTTENKPKKDKIGLYIGLAVVGCLVVFGLIIWSRKQRKRP